MADTIRVGHIVLYTLAEMDMKEIIERRRKAGDETFRGNAPHVGDELPAVIVRDWGGSVNIQVLLDGNHTHWATSRTKSESGHPEEGRWRQVVQQSNAHA